VYTAVDREKRQAEIWFEDEVRRALLSHIRLHVDTSLPSELDALGGEGNYIAAVSEAIGFVMVLRVPGDVPRENTMQAVYRIVKGEIEGAGAELAKLKEDLAEGRKCKECSAKMELDKHHTRLWDFWTCPKCGYWDCTKHIIRNWPPKGKGK
jgi:hypothetical protein